MSRFWADSSGCAPAGSGLASLLHAGPELFLDEPSAACLRRDAADLVRFLSDAPVSHRPWRFRRFFFAVSHREATFDLPTLLAYLNEDVPSLERKLRAAQRRHRGSAGSAPAASP